MATKYPKKSEAAKLRIQNANRDQVGRFSRNDGQLPGLPPQADVEYSAQFNAIPNPLNNVFYNPDIAFQANQENASRMEADLAISSPLQERVSTTSLLPYSVIPPDETDSRQIECAEFLQGRIDSIPHLRDFFYWLNKGGIWKGAAATWFDFEWDFSPGFEAMKIARWVPIDRDSLLFDDKGFAGYRIGVKRKPNDRQFVTIEGRGERVSDEQRDNWLVHEYRRTAGEFRDWQSAASIFGKGLRSTIYATWVQKMEILSSIGTWIEKFKAGGLTIYYYELGNIKSYESAKEASVKQAGSCSLLIPRSVGENAAEGVEVIDPPDGLSELMSLVEHFDKQIRLMITGQELTAGAEATGLGSNLASVHENTFQRLCKTDSMALADTITNQLLPVFQNYSIYRDLPPCRFEFSHDVDDADAKLGRAKILYDMGIKVSEQELRAAAGFTMPLEDEEQTFDDGTTTENVTDDQEQGGA